MYIILVLELSHKNKHYKLFNITDPAKQVLIRTDKIVFLIQEIITKINN